MERIGRIRSIAATLLLALWWGGFTFYAARVVFIGHTILKSKLRQGFITERVTYELNWLALFALTVTAWQIWHSKAPSRAIWRTWAATFAATIALCFLHSHLFGMLDFPRHQVFDDSLFYKWHRVYLLTATFQWLAGTALLTSLTRGS